MFPISPLTYVHRVCPFPYQYQRITAGLNLANFGGRSTTTTLGSSKTTPTRYCSIANRLHPLRLTFEGQRCRSSSSILDGSLSLSKEAAEKSSPLCFSITTTFLLSRFYAAQKTKILNTNLRLIVQENRPGKKSMHTFTWRTASHDMPSFKREPQHR